MPQLAECFCLDLTDAFARYVKLSADFFQRVVGVHIDAETHTQDFCLTRCQAFEDFFGYFVQAGVHCRIGKRNIVGIFDEVAQVRIVVVADGVSIEIGSLAIFMILRILSSGICISSASLAESGSSPVS